MGEIYLRVLVRVRQAVPELGVASGVPEGLFLNLLPLLGFIVIHRF